MKDDLDFPSHNGNYVKLGVKMMEILRIFGYSANSEEIKDEKAN